MAAVRWDGGDAPEPGSQSLGECFEVDADLTTTLWKLPSLSCGDSAKGSAEPPVKEFHEHPTAP